MNIGQEANLELSQGQAQKVEKFDFSDDDQEDGMSTHSIAEDKTEILHYNTPITIYLSDDENGSKKRKKTEDEFANDGAANGETTVPTAPSNNIEIKKQKITRRYDSQLKH